MQAVAVTNDRPLSSAEDVFVLATGIPPQMSPLRFLSLAEVYSILSGQL
jgi:hypothetical protein